MNYCDRVVKPKQTRAIKPTRLVPSGVVSFRNIESIPCESPLERDFLYLITFDPDVVEVVPQPVRLWYQGRNGRRTRYTPDFLVYYKTKRPILAEVKPREELQKSWVVMKPKFKEALHYAKAHSWAFRIFDEQRIRTPQLACIKSLQPFKQLRLGKEEIEEACRVCKRAGRSTLGRLLGEESSLGRDLLRAAILHQVASLALCCDMKGPVTDQTEIWGSP